MLQTGHRPYVLHSTTVRCGLFNGAPQSWR